MALITEDGTGLAGAESYISVAECDTYHSNMANADWALLSTANKEAALRKATQYMIGEYQNRWTGYRLNDVQALDFPRDYMPRISALSGTLYYPNNIVPKEVKEACAELALKASSASLLADTTQQVLTETVGQISVTYDKSSPQVTKYRAIDAMLAIYLGGCSDSVKLVRA